MQSFFATWLLSRKRDLNPRPSDYKSDALPTELLRLEWTFLHGQKNLILTYAQVRYSSWSFTELVQSAPFQVVVRVKWDSLCSGCQGRIWTFMLWFSSGQNSRLCGQPISNYLFQIQRPRDEWVCMPWIYPFTTWQLIKISYLAFLLCIPYTYESMLM